MNSQQMHEKIFDVIKHCVNANQNYNKIVPAH